MQRPELSDRKTLKFDAEAGVLLTDKPGICYTVWHVEDNGQLVGKTGQWFNYNSGSQARQKAAAAAAYEATVAEAKRFL